jgi:hypothetical protein
MGFMCIKNRPVPNQALNVLKMMVHSLSQLFFTNIIPQQIFVA